MLEKPLQGPVARRIDLREFAPEGRGRGGERDGGDRGRSDGGWLENVQDPNDLDSYCTGRVIAVARVRDWKTGFVCRLRALPRTAKGGFARSESKTGHR